MEDFAAEIAENGTAESIAQMYDQYLNFIVGEPDLFNLGMGKDTYWALNSAQAKDEEIDALVDRTVSGLFSVVVTMGQLQSKSRDGSALADPDRLNTHHSIAEGWSRRDDSS